MAFPVRCPLLQTLDVSNNGITDVGCQAVAAYLAGDQIKAAKTVTPLSRSVNQDQRKNPQIEALEIMKHKNPTLKKLVMAGSHITGLP